MNLKNTALHISVSKSLNGDVLTSKHQLVMKNSVLAIAALAMGTSAFAQDESKADLPEVTLEPITVTATRLPTPSSNTIAQTRVIDSEELKRYQGRTVLDVLKNQSGINITQSGGLGTSSNFYMRGFDSKQVLILIDGMRYSSVTTGQPALNLLPAEQIERIEIVYGASGSSIYGSDAMGGIIQMFTKGNNISQSNVSVTAGVGSHDQYLYGATAQFTNNQGTNLSLSATHNKTDGINAIESGANFQSDIDGFDSKNASLALQHQFNNKLTAGITTLYSDSKTDFDSEDQYDWKPPYKKIKTALKDVYADQKNGAANAFIKYDGNSNITKFTYGYSIDESDNYQYEDNIGKPSSFNTKQKSARLENIAKIGRLAGTDKKLGQLIYGTEYLEQSVDSTQKYDQDKRDITSGFVGYTFEGEKFSLQSNFRLDDNSQYDRNNTYNVGAAFKLTDAMTFGANHSTGFRAPTFNDLYWPDYGNPDLKPETSETTEVFLNFSNDIQNTRLTGYHTDAENLITSGKNIGKAKIKGVSLTSDWVYDSFLFGLGYDYLEAEDDTRSSATYGKQLDHRPENSGLLYVGYQQPKFDVRVEAKYIDERNSDSAKIKLDNYTLVNLSGNYHFTPNLTGNLRVDNLTDEDYTLSHQWGTKYATDGTNYFGSLTYKWQ